MEQKLSDTLVKAIDRSNPMMQNLQLASRFNKLVDEGGADLEDDKEATIDVSAYTDPVEIEPTAGKGGMKKATVTLTNIPSGGVIEANKEATIDVSTYTEPVEIEPTEGKDGMAKATVTLSNIPSGGSWHDTSDLTTSVSSIINTSNAIVAFRMKVSSDLTNYVRGSIMGGDGDGGITVSACGMKIIDYWDKPAECFFDTGFDIGYIEEHTWSSIATAILNAYNTSTGGSDTLTSFEIYY